MSVLTGKSALVCGASQGIGRASAVEIAKLGANVTALARDEAALSALVRELPTAAGQRHAFIAADFTKRDELIAKVSAQVKANGGMQILVNNTGGPPSGPLLDATPEAFLSGITNHVVCFQLLVQTLLPGMKAAGYGRIVNIISTSVIQPIKGLGVSNTTRGAVANWGRSLAGELAPLGITVNNILPGYTDTSRLRSLLQKWADRDRVSYADAERTALTTIPMARLAKAEEIAAVVAFLTTPAASYVTGVNLPVDGGRTAVQ